MKRQTSKERKRIGVPRERRAGERRVAATPETVKRLRNLGFDVMIEAEAGAAAAFGDDDYRDAGAVVVRFARTCGSAAALAIGVFCSACSESMRYCGVCTATL